MGDFFPTLRIGLFFGWEIFSYFTKWEIFSGRFFPRRFFLVDFFLGDFFLGDFFLHSEMIAGNEWLEFFHGTEPGLHVICTFHSCTAGMRWCLNRMSSALLEGFGWQWKSEICLKIFKIFIVQPRAAWFNGYGVKTLIMLAYKGPYRPSDRPVVLTCNSIRIAF